MVSMRRDGELIAGYLAGDEDAFEAFYRRHRRQVYVYLLSCVRNRATAEELLQEAFLTFVRHAAKLRDRHDLKACLLHMARSRAVDFLRREGREAKARRERSEDPMFRPRVDSSRGSSAALDAERLTALVHRLPGPQREAVVLRVFVGMKFGEIATTVGVSENTVVSRYRYGIQKLRAAMGSRSKL